ncbi:uncharacterized protein T551_03231 [Pneumocystis jirovecii RU7]|uniref:Eukaryotic translation initiation factor 3 subunit E n=1 Tax=Pneumocystis jirovecii (strain RU7) TaxID=1408657 RepID=A0A0W4ZFU8_PNEJ7|nr:uncharacterized protein T551_03231 [Pneumocystis jirovecii RU7]KTW27237.1 hypothetical protein T551_03231 [Pneumocystis jirovecii RU7]
MYSEIKEKASFISSDPSQYDLVPRMLPYLDKHLIFPLLEFLQEKNIYEKKVMLQAKYDLLIETYMTDYIINLSQEISFIDPLFKSYIEFTKKKEEVEMFDALNSESQKVLEVLDNPEVIAALKQDKAQNLQYLKDSHGLTVEMINSLYKFGNFQYNSGNYASAVDLLYHFRALSMDNELNVSATWGKLASEILTVNWERALEEVNKLKEIIDTKSFSSPIFQLKHRTWLIHWSLFPFFNHETGRIALCELFFSPSYMNTIQTSCPWILRYLTVAVITTRSQVRNAMHYQRRMKELVKVIDQESYEYMDPVIQFIKVLYIQFDFEDAQNSLKEAEEILKNDFFLVGMCSEFVNSAHYLMAEAYCKIYQRIDIDDLSKRLNFSHDQIVKFIHDDLIDLNAKIDFKEGTIVMNHLSQPIYQQVIERTKGLNFRTQVLAQAIARRQQGDKKETISEIVT